MPLAYLMTWCPDRKRWAKKYKGTLYFVSCRQLGAPETKEGSREAANQWWSATEARILANLSAEQLVVPHRLDPVSEKIAGIMDGLDIHDLRRLIAQGEAAAKILQILEQASLSNCESSSDLLPVPAPGGAAAQLGAGQSIPTSVVDEVLLGTELNEPTRLAHLNDISRRLVPDVEPERTMEAQAGAWVKTKQTRHVMGRISAGRFDAYRRNVRIFVDWFGGRRDVGEVNALTLKGFYDHLGQQIALGRWRPDYAKNLFGAAKNLISYIAESGLIPLPGNIRSKEFGFAESENTIEHFTAEEVQSLLVACNSDRTKLFLLLMLNCGMYQNDVAELKDKQVDWERGLVRRARSKRKKGLVVTYRLWPDTFDLLKKHRSGEDRVLLSEEGNPLVLYQVRENGKLRRYDLVEEAYRNVTKKIGQRKPLKVFRKTAANFLEQHKEYCRFVDYFLAHRPKTLAQRSYVIPSDDQFFAALNWLREELIPPTLRRADTANHAESDCPADRHS